MFHKVLFRGRCYLNFNVFISWDHNFVLNIYLNMKNKLFLICCEIFYDYFAAI